MIDHEQTRRALLDYQRGTLPLADSAEVEAHLASCAECRAIDSEERALTELLVTRLPRTAAPAELKLRLLRMAAATSTPAPASVPKPRRALAPWTAAVASLAVAAAALLWPRPDHTSPRPALIEEAVNDHLRVLYAAEPLEIRSTGIHDVKPWFTGRIDFAPDVGFSGDEDFPLVGGAVAYFIDGKAATFVFKHRLHTLSLFVFRAGQLTWPSGSTEMLGRVPLQRAELRGFHVLVWRSGELGHALVSDAESATVMRLASKVVQQP
jgi:anti-sigma factor RsiW